MKGATLRQRLACGAAPRRSLLASTRPGIRVCVIVPSKDNASGSSGQPRLPLLWTFPDSGSSRGVLKHKQVLEEMFSREVEEPTTATTSTASRNEHLSGSPSPTASTSTTTAQLGHSYSADSQERALDQEHETRQQQQQQGDLHLNGLSIHEITSSQSHLRSESLALEKEEEDQEQQLLLELQQEQAENDIRAKEAAALRERILSPSLASTSASSSDSVRSHSYRNHHNRIHNHHHHYHHNYHQQQQQPGLPKVTDPMGGSLPGGTTDSASDEPHTHTPGGAQPQVAFVPGHPHHHPHQQQVSQHHDSGLPDLPLPSQHGNSLLQTQHHTVTQPSLNPHHQQHQQQQQLHHTRLNPQHQQHHHHQQPAALQHGATAAAGAPPGAAAAAATSAPVAPAADGGIASSSSSSGSAAAVTVAAAASSSSSPPAARDSPSSIPSSIWILCCISAALTCASCVFNTALPIYMVSELKMSMRSMGMFEGFLEAFSYVVRMCSGVISDRMTSRKAAITLGFAAGAAAKFGMASAGSVGLLFAGKAVDRLANGIQAAPRDALIGDLSPPGVRSACFGLAQSLRKWGSAVGALAAFFLMKASNNNYQLIFYSAAAVSLTACLAFVVFVPAHTTRTTSAAAPAAAAAAATAACAAPSGPAVAGVGVAAPNGGPALLSGAREAARVVFSMGADFYRMLVVISLYALGHINESLLEARAMEVGFGKAEATLVVAAIAAVTFLTAYPLGLLDDRYGAGTTFAVGIGALIAGDLVLLLSGPHPLALFASCLFLGVHWAVIQGPLLSIVSGLAPPHLRGTAFGIFYTVMAATAVAANTMYGSIWHTYGANAAFMTSAALMSAVLAALPYMLPASARRGAAAPAAAAAPPPAASPLSSLTGAPSVLPAAA